MRTRSNLFDFEPISSEHLVRLDRAARISIVGTSEARFKGPNPEHPDVNDVYGSFPVRCAFTTVLDVAVFSSDGIEGAIQVFGKLGAMRRPYDLGVSRRNLVHHQTSARKRKPTGAMQSRHFGARKHRNRALIGFGRIAAARAMKDP